MVPKPLQRGAGVARVTADDESFRHGADVAFDDEGGDRRGERISGGTQGKAQAHRQRAVAGEEVFARVAGDFLAAVKRGQGIDEAEEVGFERGVAHGAVEQHLLPVGGVEDALRFALELTVQLAAEALDIVLEENVVRGGKVRIFRGGFHALIQVRSDAGIEQPMSHTCA